MSKRGLRTQMRLELQANKAASTKGNDNETNPSLPLAVSTVDMVGESGVS